MTVGDFLTELREADGINGISRGFLDRINKIYRIIFYKHSVILSLSKDQFRRPSERQTELILRQAQDD
jgi:hypothetical protein